MTILLYPSNDLSIMTRLITLVTCLILIAFGCIFASTAFSAAHFLPKSYIFLSGLIAIFVFCAIASRRSRAITRHSADENLSDNISRLIFSRDNRLKSVWIGNKVCSVAAYTCYKLFRNYLELHLIIHVPDTNNVPAHCSHQKNCVVNLYIDESRITSDDLCRLRRAFLLVPKLENTLSIRK